MGRGFEGPGVRVGLRKGAGMALLLGATGGGWQEPTWAGVLPPWGPSAGPTNGPVSAGLGPGRPVPGHPASCSPSEPGERPAGGAAPHPLPVPRAIEALHGRLCAQQGRRPPEPQAVPLAEEFLLSERSAQWHTVRGGAGQAAGHSAGSHRRRREG